MEDRILKLLALMGLLALIVWAVASALGKRDQVTGDGKHKRHKPEGAMWTGKNVPNPATRVPMVIPIPGR